MIIEKSSGNKVIVWSSKLSKTHSRPMLLRVFFNKDSNELEFCDGHIFCKHYSIEELESMLKYLKEKNKKVIKK